MFPCDVCGAIYEWEMFLNNHRRSVHKQKVTKKPRTLLTSVEKTFLKYYFKDVCKNPTLDEIKHLSTFLNIKKESAYWWFFNQIKKEKHDRKSSNKRRASDATSDRKKEKRIRLTHGEGKDKRRALDVTSDGEKQRNKLSNERGTFDLVRHRKKKERERVSKEKTVGIQTETDNEM